MVLTLLAYGCLLQAIVMAFGFDERTVKKCGARAGWHCKVVHKQLAENSQLDLQQVQADEIKAKIQDGSVWIAMTLVGMYVVGCLYNFCSYHKSLRVAFLLVVLIHYVCVLSYHRVKRHDF